MDDLVKIEASIGDASLFRNTGISRRWFLLGGATVLAASVLPEIVKPQAATLVRLSPRFDYRAIYDFMFSVDRDGTGNQAAFVSLCRVDGNALLNYGVTPGGCLRWRAFDGNEIISTADAPLLIKVEPAVASGEIHILYNADRLRGEAMSRERQRVAACKTCDGVGYRKKTVIVVPTNGMDEWEADEYEDEPCLVCGGLDLTIMRGRSFCETFRFGAGDEATGGNPCALNVGDEDWSPLGAGTILQRLGRVLDL